MNLEKLDAAIAYIQAHPEEHDQCQWFSREACGTTACLAGTLAMLDGWTPVWHGAAAMDVEKDGRKRHVSNVACDLLGIDYDGDERGDLFFGAEDIDDIKRLRDEYARSTP